MFSLELAVTELTERIAVLGTQVESQEMKQLDLSRINIERQNLSEHIKTIRDKRSQGEDRAWQKELEASQIWDQCVDLLEEYAGMYSSSLLLLLPLLS